MKNKKTKSFDVKKLIVPLLVLNFVALLGLGGYVLVKLNKDPVPPVIENPNLEDVQIEAKPGTEVDAMIQSADNAMADVYSMLIKGTTFNVDDGIVFSFGDDGNFSGYYDEENPNVTNYKYKVIVGKDKTYKLYIYNYDGGVEYKMAFNSDGDVVLDESKSGTSYVLKY